MGRRTDGQMSIRKDTEVDFDAPTYAAKYIVADANTDADDAADADDTAEGDNTSDADGTADDKMRKY